MPTAAGYIETSLSPQSAFSTALRSLKNSKYKKMNVDNSALIANYRTPSSSTNNSWGEKIKIVVRKEKNSGSTILISSDSHGGKESEHKVNIEEIINLFLNETKNQSTVIIKESGLIPAAKITAATTTWLIHKAENDDNNSEGDDTSSDGDSGFNFFG
jgi:hypothetical protein